MKLKFMEKKPEVPGVYSFVFKPEKPIKWRPGQYLHYELPHPHADDRGISRWFTISATPYEKQIRLTTRFDPERGSTFKKALFNLEPGAQVEAGEPRGDFVYDPDAARMVFIAGGIGITPYRSILKQRDHEGKQLNVDLFWANQDKNLVFGDEMQNLADNHPEFKFKKFIGKRIQKEDFEPYLADEDIIFYLSGPKPMVESYQHLLESLGVYGDRIKLDYFPGY